MTDKLGSVCNGVPGAAAISTSMLLRAAQATGDLLPCLVLQLGYTAGVVASSRSVSC